MARILKYPSRGTLFAQGDVATGPFLLIKGWIKLKRVEEDGSETLSLAINENPEMEQLQLLVAALGSEPGPSLEDIFQGFDLTRIHGGCLLGFDETRFQERHFITAEAATPCTLCALETDDIVRASRDRERVARVLAELNHFEKRHEMRLRTRAGLSAANKLQEFLWDLIQITNPRVTNGATRLYLPITCEEQGQAIGITPQHLRKTFNKLRDEGVLSKTNGRIDILRLGDLWHREA